MIVMAMDSNYLMADESSIPVQHKDHNDSKAIKGCMLVKVAPQECVTVMEYIKTKEKKNLLSSLQSLTGHLQVDGNVSYEELDKKKMYSLTMCISGLQDYFGGRSTLFRHGHTVDTDIALTVLLNKHINNNHHIYRC